MAFLRFFHDYTPRQSPPDFICIIAYFKRQGKGKMRNRSWDRANSPPGTFSFFRIYKTSDKKSGKIRSILPPFFTIFQNSFTVSVCRSRSRNWLRRRSACRSKGIEARFSIRIDCNKAHLPDSLLRNGRRH